MPILAAIEIIIPEVVEFKKKETQGTMDTAKILMEHGVRISV